MQQAKATIAIPKPQVQRTSFQHRKRIGIYGGTFNPVHNAHLLAADQVGKTLLLNKVLFMPDMIPPHVDHKEAIDAEDRVNMLQLAIEDNPLFGIEMAEIERGGISYTYDTMKYLKSTPIPIITSLLVAIWWTICQNGTRSISWLNW